MSDYLWMRHEFPWLGHGFVHAVADDHAMQLADDLESRGCRIITLRGEEMTTPRSFWAQIKTAFEFPDYFGSNWDAFNDSFGDVELGTRTVILWRRADLVAQTSLKLFAEGIAMLYRTATAMDEFEQKQLIIVLSGEGKSFTTPE